MRVLTPVVPAVVPSNSAQSVSAAMLSPLPSSLSHSSSLVSQPSPVVMVMGSMSGDLNVPLARGNVPGSCMKEVMPCEMSPRGII